MRGSICPVGTPAPALAPDAALALEADCWARARASWTASGTKPTTSDAAYGAHCCCWWRPPSPLIVLAAVLVKDRGAGGGGGGRSRCRLVVAADEDDDDMAARFFLVGVIFSAGWQDSKIGGLPPERIRVGCVDVDVDTRTWERSLSALAATKFRDDEAMGHPLVSASKCNPHNITLGQKSVPDRWTARRDGQAANCASANKFLKPSSLASFCFASRTTSTEIIVFLADDGSDEQQNARGLWTDKKIKRVGTNLKNPLCSWQGQASLPANITSEHHQRTSTRSVPPGSRQSATVHFSQAHK